ncbi:MAG: class GN sortase [Lysobacterales bacterium CG_4_9_14_3_um_filter_62_6]|nr:MAG: class GN sortase [Xanthomonadales bacterium CG_4_9_14_3_um_filter_62_6]
MPQHKLRAAALLLAICALAQIASALYPLAKGALAMRLIARSYALAPGTRPWPGADFHVVARLQSQRLGITQYVLDPASARALAFGPGLVQRDRHSGSVLSGHRDSHFSWLRDLRIGDYLALDRNGHTERYRVSARQVVDRRKQSLAVPAANLLQLTTCWPFDALSAGGDLRYVVTAVADS